MSTGDKLLTHYKAKVDPRYHLPAGEWIRSTGPAKILTGGPLGEHRSEHEWPAGMLVKVSCWDGDGLLVEHRGQPPQNVDGLLVWLPPDWSRDWEIVDTEAEWLASLRGDH